MWRGMYYYYDTIITLKQQYHSYGLQTCYSRQLNCLVILLLAISVEAATPSEDESENENWIKSLVIYVRMRCWMAVLWNSHLVIYLLEQLTNPTTKCDVEFPQIILKTRLIPTWQAFSVVILSCWIGCFRWFFVRFPFMWEDLRWFWWLCYGLFFLISKAW